MCLHMLHMTFIYAACLHSKGAHRIHRVAIQHHPASSWTSPCALMWHPWFSLGFAAAPTAMPFSHFSMETRARSKCMWSTSACSIRSCSGLRVTLSILPTLCLAFSIILFKMWFSPNLVKSAFNLSNVSLQCVRMVTAWFQTSAPKRRSIWASEG